MMKMHNLPIREGNKEISKKTMKLRLKEHFVEHHFRKQDDTPMSELPQIISKNPCDIELNS